MSDVSQLADLLALEHSVLYAYGTIGGVLAAAHAPAQQWARDSFRAHRTHRDLLSAQLLARHAAPPVALPAYQLPGPLGDPAACLALGSELEDRCSVAAHDALGATDSPQLRALLVLILRESAAMGARARALAGASTADVVPALPGS